MISKQKFNLWTSESFSTQYSPASVPKWFSPPSDVFISSRVSIWNEIEQFLCSWVSWRRFTYRNQIHLLTEHRWIQLKRKWTEVVDSFEHLTSLGRFAFFCFCWGKKRKYLEGTKKKSRWEFFVCVAWSAKKAQTSLSFFQGKWDQIRVGNHTSKSLVASPTMELNGDESLINLYWN